jgi:hypothetical protein
MGYINQRGSTGSILVPVLFNVYINDIFQFVQDSIIYYYADRSIRIAAINLLSSKAFFQSSIILSKAVWHPKPYLNAESRGLKWSLSPSLLCFYCITSIILSCACKYWYWMFVFISVPL